jgi:hypothetical protein
VFDERQLRELSQAERRRLIRVLAALEHPGPDPDHPSVRRRRAIALAVIVVCCLVLAAWIGILAVTLPRYYRAGGWRGAWVGFDLALLGTFAATGWAAWRRRQVLIVCLIVLATLLCCDAWFDVVLDARTKGFELSLLTALIIELPLAALAANGARRLLHVSIAAVRRYDGESGPVSLRQVRLIGGAPGSHLSDIFKDPRPHPDEAAAAAAARAARVAEAAYAAGVAEAVRSSASPGAAGVAGAAGVTGTAGVAGTVGDTGAVGLTGTVGGARATGGAGADKTAEVDGAGGAMAAAEAGGAMDVAEVTDPAGARGAETATPAAGAGRAAAATPLRATSVDPVPPGAGASASSGVPACPARNCWRRL